MEEKKTNSKLAIVSVLIAVILTSIGVAFGYFVWNSTTNTDISFTVEGAVVQLDDGADITGANLMPVASYTSGGKNVVKKDIKIKLKDTVSDTVTVDFKLKINSIDSGLKHSSFKYNLVNASGTSVKSGNFATSKAGDSISLLTLSTTDGSLTTSLTSYTLYIYIDGASGDNPSSMMNQSFDMSFIVEGANSSMNKMVTGIATTVISNLDKGSDGNSGSGVYKVTHSAIPASSSATGSEIPAVTDYRYYGPSPNNYICLDMEGGSTCPDKHLYRIIGSIYEEKENTNRIKVIKATPLTDGTTKGFSWDYKVNNGRGSYDNIWATITSGNYSNSLTSGSQLMKLLNSGAWWNGTSGSYYNNSTTATSINFTNYKLSDRAKSYITTSRYYLGGYNSSQGVMTNQFYAYERGTARYDTNRPLYWDGYVGLMYPSDYGYAAGNTCVNGTELYDYSGQCKNKDWLLMTTSSDYTIGAEWLMSPDSGHSVYAFPVSSAGFVGNGDNLFTTYSARPVFYLNSSASITDGEGTSAAPYILS